MVWYVECVLWVLAELCCIRNCQKLTYVYVQWGSKAKAKHPGQPFARKWGELPVSLGVIGCAKGHIPFPAGQETRAECISSWISSICVERVFLPMPRDLSWYHSHIPFPAGQETPHCGLERCVCHFVPLPTLCWSWISSICVERVFLPMPRD